MKRIVKTSGFLLFLAIMTRSMVIAENILVVSAISRSHLSMLLSASEGLIRRGHVLYAALPEHKENLKKVAQRYSVKPLLYYRDPAADFNITSTEYIKKHFESILNRDRKAEFHFIETVSHDQLLCCEAALDDKTFTEQAKELNFSLALIDGTPLAPCLSLIADKLNIPFVDVFNIPSQWRAGVQAPLSFVPMFSSSHNERMTLKERFSNFMTFLLIQLFPPQALTNYTLLRIHTSDPKVRTWEDIARKASMYLITADPILRYPEPVMPQQQYLGAVSARPALPVPTNIETFIQAFPRGFVLVSFGTLLNEWPEEFLGNLFHGLVRFKDLGIIIKYPEMGKLKGDNILIIPWIPQNDLLGHPMVRLFVTHCGANSLHEAVYHAVPMVGIPVFADQPANCNIMQYRKMGLTLKIHSVTTDAFYNTVTEVLQNPVYKERVVKYSRIMRSRPLNATDQMVHWVEHVLQFGDEHMRSANAELNWFQFLLLDVLSIIGLTVVSALLVVIFSCCYLWKRV